MAKTDVQLLRCACVECRAELSYRDNIRGSATLHATPPTYPPVGHQYEMFPNGGAYSEKPDPYAYEDIPARKYSG